MSNLGGYQTLTSAAKKAGGPDNLIMGIGLAGFLAVRTGEMGVRYLFRKISDRRSQALTGLEVYTVHTDALDDSGLQLTSGQSYRVLDRDDDAVLVEVIGRDDNPHVVSATFLASISTFPTAPGSKDA